MTPKTLYKFYPPHWGRDAIYRRRFKITTLGDINDPFEFLATSSNEKLRKDARKLRSEKFGKQGVISFSKTWAEPLLWSHYAQNHEGIALGFELRNPKIAYRVDYRDERVQMINDDPDQYAFGEQLEFWDSISVRKHKSWQYEREVRVFPSLRCAVSENRLYFEDFAHLGKLKEVILGANYVPTNDENLNNQLAADGVRVITSRLGFQRFEVTEQLLSKRQKVL